MRIIPLPHERANNNPQLGTPGVVEVWDVERLKPNPLNPRGEIGEDDPTIQELAASIRHQGLREPILCTPDGLIVAGHRRRIACLLAGVKRVRVIVERLEERAQLEIMLVENLQRQDLDPLQEARGYDALRKKGASISDITRSTGILNKRISNCLALLTLPERVQRFFAAGVLPLGAVKPIAALVDPELQLTWASRAAASNWSATSLEAAIRKSQKQKPKANGTKPTRHPENPTQPTLEVLLNSISGKRGWPVKLEAFQNAIEETGCSCSLVESDALKRDLCSSCPLSRFLSALLRNMFDANSKKN